MNTAKMYLNTIHLIKLFDILSPLEKYRGTRKLVLSAQKNEVFNSVDGEEVNIPENCEIFIKFQFLHNTPTTATISFENDGFIYTSDPFTRESMLEGK